jgi:hypothetical protein
MTLDASGNLGLGVTSPATRLHVVGGLTSGLLGTSGNYAVTYNPDTAGNSVFWTKSDGYFAIGTGSNPYSGGTERLRIDSSGNVGIGTTPNAWVAGASCIQTGGYAAFGQGRGGTADLIASWNAVVTSGSNGGTGYVYRNTGDIASSYEQNGTHRWYVAPSGTAGNAISFTEAARINSDGALLVGKSTAGTITTNGVELRVGYSMFAANNTGTSPTMYVGANGTSGGLVEWYYTATRVGTVTTNGTSTSYNTSSDYRLKEDVQPMTGASGRVLALKPVNFAWKADGSRVDGFLAHEAQAVVPEAVTGAKDDVDADGNPQYQGIDQSKLVPLLTAALQEALKRIEALEARITALEA